MQFSWRCRAGGEWPGGRRLDRGSEARPKLAAWLPAAVDPTAEARRQVPESIAGYREMFLGAGFDEAVERAGIGSRAHDLVEALPDEAVGVVGFVGSLADVQERLETYSTAGLDEVALVLMTAGDPGGERTLQARKSLS